MSNNVEYFEHDDFKLAFRQQAKTAGDPILLIHGFSSSSLTNWVTPSWFELLVEAGYHVIAIDNRGHGLSTKSHNPQDYFPELMANDAFALLEHLGIEQAHVMGYSMGARISAYLALQHPEKVQSIIFGGMGAALTDDPNNWKAVHDALLASDPVQITDPRGRMFRKFADNNQSDRQALAACIMTSKKVLTKAQVQEIVVPALVAIGSKDDIAGSPYELGKLLPNSEVLEIPDRDHMLAVGDKVYKQSVIDFLAKHQI